MELTDQLSESELQIASALADMAIARGGTFDDYQTPIYLRALVDLDAGLVARACEAFGLEPREAYAPVVPAVGAIRQRVAQLAREDTARAAGAKLLPMPARENPDEPTFFCRDCWDEPFGWRPLRCRGVGPASGELKSSEPIRPCGRMKAHGAHTYVEQCACYGVNPVSAAHRRRMDEARVKREVRR